MSKNVGPLSHLNDLAGRYDAVLSDIWGVLHNGVRPYAEAMHALSTFRSNGGRVVLVSNAARPAAEIEVMLTQMGVPANVYDAIVTSGDVTRDAIAKFSGQHILHVGPQTDTTLFDGLPVVRGSLDDAAAVVVTGLGTEKSTPEAYDADMSAWLQRRLPFICANPDKVVEIDGELVFCAGALADVYAARGGTVILSGKPYPPIYNRAFSVLDGLAEAPVSPNRILAIGDSVRTDATGAANAGIDFLFITGSVHADELRVDGGPAAVNALVAESGAHLAGYQEQLR